MSKTPIPDGGEEKIKLRSIKFSVDQLKKYDCALILTYHTGVDYDSVAKKVKVVVDTRNAIKSRKYKNVFRTGG